MRTFHEDLQEYLDKYAVKCSIINESTKNGNKSIKELKRGSASEMMLSAHREVLREKAKLEPIRREFAFKQAAIDKINEEFLKLRKENEKLKKDLEVASMQREAMFDTLVNHDLFEEYAVQVRDKLQAAGIRVEMDARNEKIGYRVREAQLSKVPYMAIVGADEQEAGTVSVRARKEGEGGLLSVDDFIQKVLLEIAEKRK